MNHFLFILLFLLLCYLLLSHLPKVLDSVWLTAPGGKITRSGCNLQIGAHAESASAGLAGFVSPHDTLY